MLYWETEDPSLGIVHHLMVLSYHLQHPSLYSPEALMWGRRTLREFVEAGISTESVRKRNKQLLDSGNRDFKITARPDAQGSYDRPVNWTMVAKDVVAGGKARYIENVTAWARSINEALKQAYGESETNA